MRKIVATIEARMTSTRLPGKVLMPLAGKPALERMIERVRRSPKIDEVVVATTVNAADDAIAALCGNVGCGVFRGSEEDVMMRVLGAAQAHGGTHIVGLTGDCPLIDPGHIDRMIDFYFANGYDYVSNRLEKGLPDGFDVQVYAVSALEAIEGMTRDPIDRVHVTCYFYNHPEKFRIGSLPPRPGDPDYWPELAVTLDEPSDYELLRVVYAEMMRRGGYMPAALILDFLRENPDLLRINRGVTRKQLSEG